MFRRFDLYALPLGLLVSMLVWYSVQFPILPNELAIHFDSAGNPDGTIPKIIFPILMLLTGIMLLAFISGIEYGVRKTSEDIGTKVQWIIWGIKYFILGSFFAVTIEVIHFNVDADFVSTGRLLMTAVAIMTLSLSFVGIVQWREKKKA